MLCSENPFIAISEGLYSWSLVVLGSFGVEAHSATHWLLFSLSAQHRCTSSHDRLISFKSCHTVSISGVASCGALGHVLPLDFQSWEPIIQVCRCQQLTALSISTALVTKLLVIEQLLHPAPKSTLSAPWHNFSLCPSSQQILATLLVSIQFFLSSSERLYD